MPASATVDLSGLADYLARTLAAPTDYSPLLRRITEDLRQRTRDCFDGSHDPDGRAWAPLAASTRRRKMRRGGSAKPMIDTGLLRLETGVKRIGPLELAYGSSLPYAGFVNDGTRRIPPRPFLGISAEAADRIAEMTADFVREELLRR